ncbi:MAG: glycosyltransferase [Kiritimatiellae bacterium]|nr:glycosyltransferase [Kiritimatiellia bacterium]
MDPGTEQLSPGGALVVSWYPVQDESSGGRRRVGELLRALAPRVALLQPAPAHPGFPGAGFPTDFGRRKRGINWGMFNFRWPANRRLVRRWVLEHRPSVIVTASIWCHSPFDGLGIPRVLDAQNVDAATIAERLGPRHPFTRLVAAAERRALAESELVFCCSDADAERFRRGYGVPSAKLRVVPNGVTVAGRPPVPSAEAAALRAQDAGKTVLYFMGKTDYAPNADALRFIAGHLLPALERRAPGRFVCWANGGGPGLPAGVGHPALRWLGRVPSVPLWLAAADIAIAPVESGGGTRLKILEFLGAGKPLVATPKAAEGIDLVPGTDAELVSLDAMTDAILRLAADPARAAALGSAGRARMQASYTWESIRARWREALAPYGV